MKQSSRFLTFLLLAATALGLSALIAASPTAFTAIRYLGAAYLVHLAFRELTRHRASGRVTDREAPARLGRVYRDGLLMNLLNPKVGVFYMAILPQFIPSGAPVLGFGVLLASVHVLEGVVWYSALIWGSHAMRARLARPAVRQWTDRITGMALTGLGLKVALENH